MAKDDTEIGKHTGGLVPAKKRSNKNQYEYEKERRENLKKRPGDPAGDSRLIQALRKKAQSTGNYAESKTFQEFVNILNELNE